MTWVASAITAGTAIASAVGNSAVKSSLANKQKKRAAMLRDEQSQLKANAIDQTYLDNKKIAQNKFITGLPSTGLMKNQLTNTTADALNKSRLATTNSGDLLSAIGNINKQEQEANLTLGIKDAEYRDNALTGISLNNQAIANEKARLEAIAETKRGALRKQAGALEDASTTNKANATSEIISGVGSGIGALAGEIGGGQGGSKKMGDGINSSIGGEALKVAANKNVIQADNTDVELVDPNPRLPLEQVELKKRKTTIPSRINKTK